MNHSENIHCSPSIAMKSPPCLTWAEAAAQCPVVDVIRPLRNFDGQIATFSCFPVQAGWTKDWAFEFHGHFVLAVSCSSFTSLRKDMYMFAATCELNITAEGLRMMKGDNSSVAQQQWQSAYTSPLLTLLQNVKLGELCDLLGESTAVAM